MTHILHVGKYYPPDRGGMESFVQALAQTQAGQGHQVRVLAHVKAHPGKGAGPGLWHERPGTDTRTEAGTETRTGNETSMLSVRRCVTPLCVGGYAPVSPSMLWQLLRACWTAAPRRLIIHAHSPNAASAWALLCPTQPLILHWHADVLFTPQSAPPGWCLQAWRCLEQLCLRRAARIIVTSQEYVESSEFLQSFRHKCRVIPLALREYLADAVSAPDIKSASDSVSESDAGAVAIRFLQQKSADQVLNLLAVGRLSHYKGFHILLRAVAQLPHIRLCLVGQGEEAAALHRLAAELKLHDRLLLAGELSDAALRACYQACDAFVLPSVLRTEAFGMVLLEAMREGKSCVATHVPGSGMGSVVQHGSSGLLVAPGDVDALSVALKYLLDNPKILHEMGRAGQARWQQHYSIQAVAAQVAAVYAEVLA